MVQASPYQDGTQLAMKRNPSASYSHRAATEADESLPPRAWWRGGLRGEFRCTSSCSSNAPREELESLDEK